MRKRTLAGISYLLAVAIGYGLTFLLRSYGWRLPQLGLVMHLMAGFFISPVILIPLSKLNTYLLAWRKARGRDIVEEEKYENEDAGIISLRPTNDRGLT